MRILCKILNIKICETPCNFAVMAHNKISVVTSMWAAHPNNCVQEMERDFSLL